MLLWSPKSPAVSNLYLENHGHTLALPGAQFPQMLSLVMALPFLPLPHGPAAPLHGGLLLAPPCHCPDLFPSSFMKPSGFKPPVIRVQLSPPLLLAVITCHQVSASSLEDLSSWLTVTFLTRSCLKSWCFQHPRRQMSAPRLSFYDLLSSDHPVFHPTLAMPC